MRKRIFVLSSALAALASSNVATATPCALDEVPASTLLVPYFDVSACPADGIEPEHDTRFEVINSSADPVLNQVTIWSNAGVPVFDFEIYLAGYSRQSISLSALLCDGTLPSTGSAVSPHGQYSGAPVAFANCNATDDPANGAPVFGGSGALAEPERERIRTELAGLSSNGSTCAAIPQDNDSLEGYVTIDTVTQCTDLTPADSSYYAIIDHANVLTGEFSLIDAPNNVQASFPAVAIESAEASVYSAGDVTFYGRYNGQDASDQREPLPTTYAPRLVNQGAYDTAKVLVWRESNAEAGQFTCGTAPNWYPLGLSNRSGQDSEAVFEIDGDGVGRALAEPTRFPLATQALDSTQLGTQSSNPTLWMNLQHGQTVYAGTGADRHGQAWVGTLTMASGRFAEGMTAHAIDSSCTNADFDVNYPGVRPLFLTQ